MITHLIGTLFIAFHGFHITHPQLFVCIVLPFPSITFSVFCILPLHYFSFMKYFCCYATKNRSNSLYEQVYLAINMILICIWCLGKL